MADHCGFCDIRRPEGGTNMLVLNGGEFWAEFCPPCGEKEILTNGETGEEITVAALFKRCGIEECTRKMNECEPGSGNYQYYADHLAELQKEG